MMLKLNVLLHAHAGLASHAEDYHPHAVRVWTNAEVELYDAGRHFDKLAAGMKPVKPFLQITSDTVFALHWTGRPTPFRPTVTGGIPWISPAKRHSCASILKILQHPVSIML